MLATIIDTDYPIPDGAYFVATNGKDINTGKSLDSPWPIWRACGSTPSGSTIVFRGGTYRNKKIFLTKRLTLQPYPHEQVWFKGSTPILGWIADGNIWRKDGWTYSFPPNVSSHHIDSKYPMSAHRDMIFIDGVALRQVASIADVKTGTFYVDVLALQLYIGDNPESKTVEGTTQVEAFSMWKNASSDPSGTVVRGMGFTHYAEQGLSVGCSHVTLENNTFAWNGVSGAYYAPDSGGVPDVSTDGRVVGNTFSYNGKKGLGAAKAHRLLAENNISTHNNIEQSSKIWDAAGIKVVMSDGIVLRNNRVENNYATGIWVDVSCTNPVVVHNQINDNEMMGIWLEISNKAIIGANVICNNPTGIYLLDSSNSLVFNNTLINNGWNLRVNDSSRVNRNISGYDAGVTWITSNNVFKNNIFSNATGNKLLHAANCETQQYSAKMIAECDFNAYYRRSSKSPLSVIEWAQNPAQCSVKYQNLATFSAATGYEKHGLAIDDVAITPFFVDEELLDFRLKPDSAALGYGEPLPEVVATALKWTLGVPVDLGAIQSNISNVQKKATF